VLLLSGFQGEVTFEIPEAGKHFYCLTDFGSQSNSVFVPENKVSFHAANGMLDHYSYF
jgi:hypothetical protein